MTSPFDKMSERLTRNLARFSSRRGFLSKARRRPAGGARVSPAAGGADPPKPQCSPKTDFERNAQATDDTKCNYWKYCGSDGVLCSCCGGGHHTCPPGAEPSPISWIGTCVNPEDGKSFVIAYRDCCGKPMCSAGKSCWCDNSDRELPTYRSSLNNDIIWCFGNCLGDLSLLDCGVGRRSEVKRFPQTGQDGGARRRRAKLRIATLALVGLAGVAGLPALLHAEMTQIPTARGNYLLSCGGCHGLDGVSNSNLVPDLKDQVGFFLNLPEGRDYVVRLPNVAFSITTDEALTGLLNYVVFTLGGTACRKAPNRTRRARSRNCAAAR